MNKQQAIEELKKHKVGFGEVASVRFDRIVSVIDQINEPKKIKIPQFVADWLEYMKEKKYSLRGALERASERAEVYEWMYPENELVFVRAWLDGYEVEQEKKYRVMLSNKQVLSKDDEFNTVFFVHDTTDLRAEFTRPELEQAGFGWVFDCKGVKVEEVE